VKRPYPLLTLSLLVAACGAVNTVPGMSLGDGGADAATDSSVDGPADGSTDGPRADGGPNADASDAPTIPFYPTPETLGTPGDDLETPGDVTGDPAPAGSVPSCDGYPNALFPAVAKGKSCPPNAPAGQVCLEEGWVCTFHRDRSYVVPAGESAHWDSAEGIANPPPACVLQTSNVGKISPVFVRGFRMDIHEFTNGDLMALLASLPPADAAKLPVPPERFGLPEKQEVEIDQATETRIYHPDQSALTGWFGRTFRPLRTYDGRPGIQYRSPVVGLSKQQAAAICKARGGRLPLVDEYQRASRGLAPNARLFPWGADIPGNQTCPTGNPLWRSYVSGAGVGSTAENGVHIVPPVVDIPLGPFDGTERTPGGVRGLMGGTSEYSGSIPYNSRSTVFAREPGIYTAPPEPNASSDGTSVELSVNMGPRGAVRFTHVNLWEENPDLEHGFRCVFDL